MPCVLLVSALAFTLFARLDAQQQPQRAAQTPLWATFGTEPGMRPCAFCLRSEPALFVASASPSMAPSPFDRSAFDANDDPTVLAAAAAYVRAVSSPNDLVMTDPIGDTQLQFDLGFRPRASQTDGSYLLGLGYRASMGKNLSLTPFANALGATRIGHRASFVQLGFGLHW